MPVSELIEYIPHPLSLRSILVSSFHLYLGPPVSDRNVISISLCDLLTFKTEYLYKETSEI
jgi:hypothetical protein